MPSARDLAKIAHETLASTARLDERIAVSRYGWATTTEMTSDPPVRIGFLSDMPVGESLGEYLDPIILALEDASNEGRLTCAVEVIAYHVVGLPTGQAPHVIAAYVDLVQRGCLLVLSTGVTNNALVLRAPPKIMNAAIMWALVSPEWMAALDGWVGIEQSLGDHDHGPKNKNWDALLDRHERRFGYRPDNTMIALLYDQGRAATEAIINAPQLTPAGLALGLERIKMMPSTLGGPRTYIGFGPGDHRGYKGDFMFMKQLRDGQFHFDSYHWPQWPISRRNPETC